MLHMSTTFCLLSLFSLSWARWVRAAWKQTRRLENKRIYLRNKNMFKTPNQSLSQPKPRSTRYDVVLGTFDVNRCHRARLFSTLHSILFSLSFSGLFNPMLMEKTEEERTFFPFRRNDPDGINTKTRLISYRVLNSTSDSFSLPTDKERNVQVQLPSKYHPVLTIYLLLFYFHKPIKSA